MTTAKQTDTLSQLVTKCPHCGKKILTLAGYIVQGDYTDSRQNVTRGLKLACDCRAAQREQEENNALFDVVKRSKEKQKAESAFERRFAASGMPENWKTRGLHLWQTKTPDQQAALDEAKTFLLEKLDRGWVKSSKSLYIAGDIGTGKTFLASCLAVDLVRHGGRVLWRNVSDVLREIRASFNQRDISEQDIIDRFISPSVLFLDDLGKERPTEWAIEQLFAILNARYDRDLPVVITTNYGGAELARRLTPAKQANGDADDTTAQAIVDRLRGTSNVVILQGGSRR